MDSEPQVLKITPSWNIRTSRTSQLEALSLSSRVSVFRIFLVRIVLSYKEFTSPVRTSGPERTLSRPRFVSSRRFNKWKRTCRTLMKKFLPYEYHLVEYYIFFWRKYEENNIRRWMFPVVYR